MSIGFIKISNHRIRREQISSYGVDYSGDEKESRRFLYIKTQERSYKFYADEINIDDTVKVLDRQLLSMR